MITSQFVADCPDLSREVAYMKLAGVTGLEPATSAVTGQRSEPVELHPRARCAEIRMSKSETNLFRHSRFDFPCVSREWALKDLNL